MSAVGDLIIHQGEKGIVCHENPHIMKTIEFHSYVPITESFEILQKHYEKSVYIKPELIERITKYLEKNNITTVPTGT